MSRRDGDQCRQDSSDALPRHVALLAASATLCLAIVAPGFALAAGWVERGPDGGGAQALVIAPSDPLTVYAGTGGNGVFRSRDGGATWTAARNGMGRPGVQALAVHPRDGQCVFAGTVDGRVFASHDGGASWRSANGSGGAAIPAGPGINALALDDANPPMLFAAAGSRVYRSQDLGQTWSSSTPGGPPAAGEAVLSLAVNHRRTGEIWAGASWGLFESGDGGETWSEKTFNGTSISPATVVAVDPGDADTVYAGSYCNWCQGPSAFPIYVLGRSRDGGRTWEVLTNEPDPVLAVSVDPSDPARLVIATDKVVAVTRDGGATWTGMYWPQLAGIREVTRDPSDAERLLAACGASVAVSRDGGANWAPSNRGLVASGMAVLAVAVRAKPVVLAGIGEEGITAYDPGSGTWTPSGDGLLPIAGESCCPGVTGIVVDPASPRTIYAAGPYTGVFKSVDGGEHWVPARSGLEQGSRSSGNFWTPALAIDAYNPSTLYAGTEMGVFKTSDGANTWSRVSSTSWPNCRAVAVDPYETSVVVCASIGIQRSHDGGLHWDNTVGVPQSVWYSSLATDPSRIGRLYAAAPRNGLYRSDDHGLTWSKLALPAEIGCYTYAGYGDTICPYFGALVVDPTAPGSIYLGTGNGVWRSLDDGTTWSPVGTGMTGVAASSIAFDVASGTIYAGSVGAGLFSLSPGRPRPHVRKSSASAIVRDVTSLLW
ncbi:MAG: WD40/YVTN/BNR-like repeat-containing protein [Thermoanaerobaculales bacterium]